LSSFNGLNIAGVAVFSEIMKAESVAEKVQNMRKKIQEWEGK
jgi:thiamine monophosphate synthase